MDKREGKYFPQKLLCGKCKRCFNASKLASRLQGQDTSLSSALHSPLIPRSRGQDEPHDFYPERELSYCLSPYSAMMLSGKLRQEVHHGYCSAADSSYSPFAFSTRSVTMSGGRHG